METFAWVAVAVVGGGLLALRLRRPARGEAPAVVFAVSLRPDGTSTIAVSPQGVPPQLLARAFLSYLAKVRWLLESEPPQALEVFRRLVEEALDFWPSTPGRVTHAMPVVSAVQSSVVEGEWAVPGGELFVVRGLLDSQHEMHVVNDLPEPGLSVNVAWHVAPILDHISEALPGELRSQFKVAGYALAKALFDSPVVQDRRGLVRLNDAANGAWEDAGRLSKDGAT